MVEDESPPLHPTVKEKRMEDESPPLHSIERDREEDGHGPDCQGQFPFSFLGIGEGILHCCLANFIPQSGGVGRCS